MKQKRKAVMLYYLLGFIGLFFGLLSNHLQIPVPETFQQVLTIAGGGLLGVGVALTSHYIKWKKDPVHYKKIMIEASDERTAYILSKAKERAYDIELYVIVPLLFFFIWQDNFWPVILVGSYFFFRFGLFFYFFVKENNRI